MVTVLKMEPGSKMPEVTRLKLSLTRAVAGSFGIVLSAVAVLVLLFSGWKGGELVFRYGVGQIGPR